MQKLIRSPFLLGWAVFASVMTVYWRLQDTGFNAEYKAKPHLFDDLMLFRAAAQEIWTRPDFYAAPILIGNGVALPFIYPPFATIALQPLIWLPAELTPVLSLLANVVFVAWIIFVTAQRLDWPYAPQIAVLLTPVFLWLDPVKITMFHGQITLFVLALIVTDLWWQKANDWLPAGILIGLAAAITLIPLFLVLYFAVAKRWRELWTVLGAFLFFAVMSVLILPRATVDFYSDVVWHLKDRILVDQSFNLSLLGVLQRLFNAGGLWGFLGCAVVGVCAWIAYRAESAGHSELAVIVVAMGGLLAAPSSWQADWVWLVPVIMVTISTAVRKQNAWLMVAGLTAFAFTLVFVPHTQMVHGYRIVNREKTWLDWVQAGFVWWAFAYVMVVGLFARSQCDGRKPGMNL